MGADALAAYKADTAVGKDALLVCDTTEMADALNTRIHHDSIAADAPTVTAARGHRIAVGDLILTRHNDAAIPLRNKDDPAAEESPVRNGQRWRVTAVNPDNNRLLAGRLSDNTLGAFVNDYVREHITLGYAVTVHSAQGVTADTSHAVLSDTATRALSYVAMTRGREANAAYLYQRPTEAGGHSRDLVDDVHCPRRDSRRAAATAIRAIIANDSRAQTAHRIAARTDPHRRPAVVTSLLVDRRVTPCKRGRPPTAAGKRNSDKPIITATPTNASAMTENNPETAAAWSYSVQRASQGLREASVMKRTLAVRRLGNPTISTCAGKPRCRQRCRPHPHDTASLGSGPCDCNRRSSIASHRGQRFLDLCQYNGFSPFAAPGESRATQERTGTG